MQREVGSQKPEFRRNRNTFVLLNSNFWLLTSVLWLLTSSLLADAPDKTRDLTKARQEERDRAAASVPVVKPAEMYRRYFTAMKAGRFTEAAASITDESLRHMKASLIRTLREAPLDELAKFLHDAGFKSAPDLQLSDPGRVFARWMRSGWRVQGFLEHIRRNEIVSAEETVHDNVCDLTIELKPVAETAAGSATNAGETVTCEFSNRVWRLRLEIPLETHP